MKEAGSQPLECNVATAAAAAVPDPAGNEGDPPRHRPEEPSQQVVVWNELVSWITTRGGTRTAAAGNDDGGGWVHPHLELRAGVSSKTERGVFAAQAIRQGETLIRLPLHLAIYDQDLPHEYDYSTTKRNASPWLRCLAAYLKLVVVADDHHCRHAYLESLPRSYETLWQWSDEEIAHYLAGTRPPSTTTTESNSWKIDRTALRLRYQEQIRPYLVHCNILNDTTEQSSMEDDDEEFQQFATACQVLSTRGFHMEPNDHQNDDNTVPDGYARPFLLPVMDLLNHGSTSLTCCTTLRRETEAFVMVAERDVAAHQEILHSYDQNRMASSQFLASFGFVPRDRMECAAAAGPHRNINADKDPPPTTSVFLSKVDDVWQAGWDVMDSEFPIQLARHLREQDTEDEAWSLSVDRSRTADSVPDHILISAIPFHNDNVADEIDDESQSTDAWSKLHMLTDELVTAVAVPLLPRCAYSEISERTLLDRSILQDYFLGQLVGAVLLKIVERKLTSYTPIPNVHIQQLRLSTTATNSDNDDQNDGEPLDRDRQILQMLLDQSKEANTDKDTPWQQRQRLAYGLTIRIEEKNTLEALRRQAVTLMALLDSSDLAEHDASVVGDDDNDLAVKKQKVDDE